MTNIFHRKYVSKSEKSAWHGWLGVFLATTILLVFGSLLFLLGMTGGQNELESLKGWVIISTILHSLVVILMAVMAKRYRRLAVREYMMAEREMREKNELMQAICANFNAVYYCDYLKNEIKFIQIGNRITANMPKEYDESHPLDWYVKTYCEKIVTDDYKSDFMKNVGPDNIRERLKDRDYFTYIYVGDKNGEPTYFQMKAAKVNGSENHFIVGFEDVNDQVRDNEVTAKMLRDALKQAETSNRARTDFLARMTSDFMNPLNEIVIAAKTLENGDADSIEKETKKILAAAGNLDNLITETIDAGHINDGKMFIENKPFDISKTISDISEQIVSRAAGENVTFNVTTQLVHEVLIGDAGKIGGIVKYIAFFALDNVDRGSVVCVNIIETQVLNRKAYFDIFFDIPNVFISEENIEKILNDANCNFAEYIGLSIAVIMTKMVGGKIEIENNTAIGTSVKLHLALNYER